VPAFTDLATAAYCPRKLYYRRTCGDHTPADVAEIRGLAFRYPDLLACDDAALREEPIAVTPTQFRARLHAARERLDRWDDLVNPTDRNVLLEGRDCRGVVHKLLDGDPTPSLVFAGKPPERGVWEPQSVHVVAAAKALSWECETRIETAYVEYPAHGVVREIDLTTRRTAAYRRTLRTVQSLDGPPPRLRSEAKCEPCEYRTTCGVRTTSLLSRLE
jgi:CRISPR-associated exonuclease Cas4